MTAQHESEKGFLPHEAASALIPPIEDKEVDYVKFDRAVIARVEDFFEGVDIAREAIQAPDKLREVETGSSTVDTATLDFSDLDSKGIVTLEGVAVLEDGDTFISGFHLASKTLITSGNAVFTETASKYNPETVDSGEVSAIHMLTGKAAISDGSQHVVSDMALTVFSFKDGRTRSFFPHSAFGQPFPEELKMNVARQMGVEI